MPSVPVSQANAKLSDLVHDRIDSGLDPGSAGRMVLDPQIEHGSGKVSLQVTPLGGLAELIEAGEEHCRGVGG